MKKLRKIHSRYKRPVPARTEHRPSERVGGCRTRTVDAYNKTVAGRRKHEIVLNYYKKKKTVAVYKQYTIPGAYMDLAYECGCVSATTTTN